MRAIVGLGNPGAGYAATRHNAGFRLADILAERWALPPFRRRGPARVTAGPAHGLPVIIVKPQTYMNLSGIALHPLLAEEGFDPARDLLVLVDEAALPLGTFRLRARGSAGGHNGLKSVEETLRSRTYARLRIGIGPPSEPADDLTDFVLGPFTPGELETLEPLWDTMAEAVECWLTDGIHAAMQRYNHLGKPRD